MNLNIFIVNIIGATGGKAVGIERRSGKCFIVVVPDRREITLRAATERWVLPGTHLISDGWASY